MTENISNLPQDLPAPEDDGAADHLPGITLPSIILKSTDDTLVDLSSLEGYWVIYIYPMTGKPGVPLPDGWDEIPGALGCTPQSCSFRDHYAELKRVNADVYGLSTQDSEYQREARDRLHLPFQLLSDSDIRLKEALELPSFSVNGMSLFKRLTLIVKDNHIVKVFYPVFPPDQNADDVLMWLQKPAK
jgi:peroxiredoxin